MKIPSRKAVAAGAAGVAVTGVAATIGAVLAARAIWHASHTMDLIGKTVLITGSTRGLGLALAEEFAQHGCRVAICGRSQDELDRALSQLQRSGPNVIGKVCDVSDQGQVQSLVNHVVESFGPIDILVNNAGTISVGPIESQTVEDFREAMDVMFWAQVYTTLAVLPEMRRRRQGRIANISSIGGKVAVPHLSSYTAAKFASVGFSEAMTAELAKDGIRVTTICPGLMRTGSHLNAWFKGNHEKEYAWFSLGATSPVSAMGARRAARSIVRAIRRGQAELILGVQAKATALLHGIAPGLTAHVMGIANRLMPVGQRQERLRGHESETMLTRSPLTVLGRKAGERLNQYPVRREAS